MHKYTVGKNLQIIINRKLLTRCTGDGKLRPGDATLSNSTKQRCLTSDRCRHLAN